ncbi:hypothetical protein C8R48DRAFT_676091 [Suillus tomentosus]|nr:hypothetical protein C8R48DRAFT_676091 [Suillus tomentosus]
MTRLKLGEHKKFCVIYKLSPIHVGIMIATSVGLEKKSMAAIVKIIMGRVSIITVHVSIVQHLEDILADLRQCLEVAEKNSNHYFELYKKYHLRWLEENWCADIPEKYAPTDVDHHSPAQLQ